MAYSITKEQIITYPPEKLRQFKVMMYEWIDNLNFTLRPSDCLPDAEVYCAVAEDIFKEAGWDGDGEVELMWIPPFMFPNRTDKDFTLGVTVWHVKQTEDGISWILSPVDLPV